MPRRPPGCQQHEAGELSDNPRQRADVADPRTDSRPDELHSCVGHAPI